MHDIRLKLENPARLAELNPKATLKRIGLRVGDVLCDIGAGSGIFAIPAAQITCGLVYAVELRADMLGIITDKASRQNWATWCRCCLTEAAMPWTTDARTSPSRSRCCTRSQTRPPFSRK